MKDLKYLQQSIEIIRKLIPLLKDFEDKKLSNLLLKKEAVLEKYIKVFYDDLDEKEKIKYTIKCIQELKPYVIKFQDLQFAKDLTDKENKLLDKIHFKKK